MSDWLTADQEARLCVLAWMQTQRSAVSTTSTAVQQCYSLPGAQARQGGAMVAWNQSLLLVCGSFLPHCGPELPVHMDDVWATNAGAAAPWRRFAQLGRQNARTHHAAAVLGDRLYVLGGYGGPNHSAPVPLDSVISLALPAPAEPPRQHRPLPTGPTTNLGVTASTTRPGVLFVAGGFVYPRVGAKVAQGETTAAVFAFRPTTDAHGDDAWSPLQPMRTARAAFGFAALPISMNTPGNAPNVRLIAAGGFSRSRTTGKFSPLALVEATTLQLESAAEAALRITGWSEIVPLPSARSQAVAVVAEIQASGAGVARLPSLVLLGGTNATADDCYKTLSILQRDTLVLDAPAADEMPNKTPASWRTLAVMQRPRGFVAAAVLDGTVVAVGGFNGTQDAPAVDALDLNSRLPKHWNPCLA